MQVLLKPLPHLASLPLRLHGVVKFYRAPWDGDEAEDGDVTAFLLRFHGDLGIST